MDELGATGLNIYAGQVREEFLKQLSGIRAIRVYTEMRDNDPLVGAVLFAVDQLLKQVEWKAYPSKQSQDEDDEESPLREAAEKEAEFLQSCLYDMNSSWSDTISEVLSMLVYGWSYHELVYKKRDTENSKYPDGRIGWKKWPIRSQESLLDWVVDDSGTIRGLVQNPPPRFGNVFIPIEKALLFRTSVYKNNPEGRSLLRNAYRPWYFKKTIEEIEAVGIERDLAGLPVMYLPVDVMKADAPDWMKAIYNDAKELVVNIRRDAQEGVILPFLTDPDTSQQSIRLELLSSGGSRSFDTSSIIERYDKRIAMTVLADFILLGHSNVGSFALSSDKTDIFAVTLGSIMRSIRDVVNDHAVPRLMKLNGVRQELWPYLDFGDIETPPLAEIASYVQALVASGVPLFPDEGLSEHLLKIAGLPKPEHSLDKPATPPGAEGMESAPASEEEDEDADVEAELESILSGEEPQADGES
jgi:hypothetical protein